MQTVLKKHIQSIKALFFLIFIFIPSVLMWQACDKKDLRSYYFPLKQLKEQPKVYEYQFSNGDTSLTIYWYHQVVIQNDSVYLVSNCYDSGFHPLVLMREEQVVNGMKLKELIYYGVNTEGYATQTKATIEGGAVFPFQVKDEKSVFVNVIKHADLKDSTKTTTLTRNRRFLNETTYDYKGKSYEAAEFEMKEEQYEKDPQKGGWTHIYTIKEIYAQNIGFVYSKRTLDGGGSIETKLVDIYTMAELEAKFKKHLNQ